MQKQFSEFQDGLDSRRSAITASEHSLQTATNVHVNQGAELEKRLAFVDWGSLPATVFGLELTAAGIVVFGSVSIPSLPSGVGYVRCQHPTDNTQGMTAILCSCSFGGNAWCAAKFANNDVFIYYNGTVIPASINGRVLSTATSNLSVATQLYNFLNTSYFSALGIFAVAPVNNAGSYYVDVYGTPGVSFTLTNAIQVSALGTISQLLISNASQGTAFTQANFGFSMYSATTGTLASILVSQDSGATFPISLLPSPVGWVSGDVTGYATALNVAATITSSLTALPITGQANNNQVTLLAAASLGATPNGYPVKLATTGDFCLDEMLVDYSVAAALTSSSFLVGSLQTVFNGQVYNGGGTFVQSLANGTYFWHKGLNDVSLAIAGGLTYYADNFFTISGGPKNITITGTASAAVTAEVTLMVEILGSATTATTIPLLVAAMATKIRTYCVANTLSYTAAVNVANNKQLIVSRSVIRSDFQFYPVVATDVQGAGGFTGTIIQSKAALSFSYIANTIYSGIINVSIVGGVGPFSATLVAVSGSGGGIILLTMPNGNPSPVTGSFLIAVGLNQNGPGGGSETYSLNMLDAAGTATTNSIIITIAFSNQKWFITSVTFA